MTRLLMSPYWFHGVFIEHLLSVNYHEVYASLHYLSLQLRYLLTIATHIYSYSVCMVSCAEEALYIKFSDCCGQK